MSYSPNTPYKDSSNSSSTPLSGGATFTGTGVLSSRPAILVQSFSDVAGTLYFDFSIDGTNWDSTYPTAGYACASGVPEVHMAIVAGRYYRVRYVNGSGAQTSFRLGTYQTNDGDLRASLNQSLGLDSDAAAVRPTSFQDEVTIGRRTGVAGWNKFAYRSNLSAVGGEELIEASGTVTSPEILTSAETFDIAYDGTGGGSTDGNGTTGATQLTFYYINANGQAAIAAHNLGTDGTDTTSFTGLGINRCVVSASGANQANVSDITITSTTSGGQQAFIPAGQSVTQQAMFHVPTDSKGVAKFVFLSANKLSGSNPKVVFKGYVFNRTVETVYEIFRYTMDTQSSTTLMLVDPVNFALSSGDVLYFVADTDQNSTVAECRFSLNVYRNT